MNRFEERAKALVDQMTTEEAAAQLKYDAPAIARLGIPAYNWWNEALHGVARAGTATVFPQAIALAAMFDAQALEDIANIVSTEARAKYNMQSSREDRDIYKGLTMWSPNINIFRDPRWGRGHETYGEDPHLTAKLGLAYIRGLQGNEKYLKTAACAKHFAVHSGPEGDRHHFNAVAGPKDMEETYLFAFEEAVKTGNVEAVMGAYNRTNGEPCCGSKTLLQDLLRDKWGFEGHVVSDCWAIRDFHTEHMVTRTAPESAAMALKNGCDLNCGNTYLHMLQALEEGLVSEEDIRRAAVRLFTTRIKLGLFDTDCAYDRIPYTANDTAAHRQTALKAARQSAVLLKNDGILPLKKEQLQTIGIIGPTADSQMVLKGNYHGTASEYVTNISGIREGAGDDIRILYSEGCHLYRDRVEALALPDDRLAEAGAIASLSDVVVLCVGMDSTIEGEQGDTGNSAAAGDKENLLLPPPQRKLVEAVLATGTPTVLVLNVGSAIDLSMYEEKANAILHCWYSGAQGGRALADILFGKVSPCGKLPVTLYYDGGLPDFSDYSMAGRTYRYLKSAPWKPFGFGLSYASGSYQNLTVNPESRTVCFEIVNNSQQDIDEIYQIYVDKNPAEKLENGKNALAPNTLLPENQPVYSLAGFGRRTLRPGEICKIECTLDIRDLQTVLEDGTRTLLKGTYTVYAGGSQPDPLSQSLTGKSCLRMQTSFG